MTYPVSEVVILKRLHSPVGVGVARLTAIHGREVDGHVTMDT